MRTALKDKEYLNERFERAIDHELDEDRIEKRDNRFGDKKEILIADIVTVCSRYERLNRLIEERYQTDVLWDRSDSNPLVTKRYNKLSRCIEKIAVQFTEEEDE